MQVKYIRHMGDDNSVVDAARVSFSKTSNLYSEEKNNRLIKYLASHGHWTPFSHTAITLHIKAPIFVARQLGKHQVGMVWNEVSRRYVTDEPEFYVPEVWRKAADNVKQGSSEESVSLEPWMQNHIEGNKPMCSMTIYPHTLTAICKSVYEDMIRQGVCPEQARMVLPQSMMTEWYWTGNLYSFANVFIQRTDSHAQKEVQEVAHQIGEIIQPLFPVSWKALTNG